MRCTPSMVTVSIAGVRAANALITRRLTESSGAATVARITAEYLGGSGTGAAVCACAASAETTRRTASRVMMPRYTQEPHLGALPDCPTSRRSIHRVGRKDQL